MKEFDYKKYVSNNPLLKENDEELKSIVRNTKVKGNLLDFEDAVKAKAKEMGLNVTDQEVEDAVEKHADAAIGLFEKTNLKEYIPMDSEEFDDDIIDLENDPVFEYNTEIYVPPHVRGEDVTVRADAENYRLPVEFLVDMAEQFGDMGNDAISFVDETIARFVHIGIAEAEKDKLYNWFDNIMYAEGTMSDPEDDGKDDDYYDMVSDIGENKILKEEDMFDFSDKDVMTGTMEDPPLAYKEIYQGQYFEIRGDDEFGYYVASKGNVTHSIVDNPEDDFGTEEEAIEHAKTEIDRYLGKGSNVPRYQKLGIPHPASGIKEGFDLKKYLQNNPLLK